jgi:hypothetical protein
MVFIVSLLRYAPLAHRLNLSIEFRVVLHRRIDVWLAQVAGQSTGSAWDHAQNDGCGVRSCLDHAKPQPESVIPESRQPPSALFR